MIGRSVHGVRWGRVAVVGLLGATVVGLAISGRLLRTHAGTVGGRPAAIEAAPGHEGATRGSQITVYSPPRVTPASTPIQSQVDSELAQAETNGWPSEAVLGGLPGPADSVAYPAVSVSDRIDPSAYATAFVTELLDRDYAHQSLAQLLAWAQSESALDTLPGVPTDLAPRSLVLSLVDAEGGSPVPSPGQWTAETAAATSQSVSGLQIQVDPDWVSLVSTGWEPTDPAMTMLTVTGTLSTNDQGRSPTQSFSLVLTLGSNGSRPGYGAVAVDDWTVR